LDAELDAYTARSAGEAGDLARIRALARSGDPWARTGRLHVTGSAIVVHPPSRRVLLRWHERQQSWLQVGGHADPGETSPFEIALREAQEETALPDLAPWPDRTRPRLVHAVIVPVPAGRGEPAHEHADLRYLLATELPDDARPESAGARLRWLSLDEAMAETVEDNLRTSLERITGLVPPG
jgi:8-oxo-dGTP pyrophosphatase MutT (NUDIX family)